MDIKNPTPITHHIAICPFVKRAIRIKPIIFKENTQIVLPGSDRPILNAAKFNNIRMTEIPVI